VGLEVKGVEPLVRKNYGLDPVFESNKVGSGLVTVFALKLVYPPVLVFSLCLNIFKQEP